MRTGPTFRGASRVQRAVAAALLGGGALAAVLPGCSRANPADETPLVWTTERGPLRVRAEITPRRATIGDTVRLHVRVEAPPEFDLALPTQRDFGDLPVRMLPAPETQPTVGGRLWQRTYEITPLSSGRIEVPQLTLRYTRPPAGTETQPVASALLSDALAFEVRSVLEPNDAPQSPRDITGVLTPPRPPRPWWFYALAGAGGALVLLLGVLAWRRYRAWRLRPPPPIAPEVWALRALAALDRQRGTDAAALRAFYYGLTGIVREYIERKFGLAAPESTTEEFLALLVRQPQALPYDAARLSAFLSACDVVKYAALDPGPDAADHALATARAFVDATAAAATQQSASAAAAAGQTAAGTAAQPAPAPSSSGGSAP